MADRPHITVGDLRKAVATGALVRVRLPSGPCWATLRAVRAARVTVDVAGVRVEVALDSVEELRPG